MEEYESILRLLPKSTVQPAVGKALAALKTPAEEIRLRAGRPIAIHAGGIGYYISENGEVRSRSSPDCLTISRAGITSVFRTVCENSVYAYADEIRRGFVTIRGGHRVGFTGRAVIGSDKRIESLRDISSVNIRIAREQIGCSEALAEKVAGSGRVLSTLIISPPGVGKTTALRDLTRIISQSGKKVGVSDDRGEIAAMYRGVPSNDVGANTDVIEYAPKGEGIDILLRTMSPEVIITDELVTEAEVGAVCRAKGCGAAIIATAHGSSFDEWSRKPMFIPLFENRVFELLVLLKGHSGGLETEVRRLL